MTMKLQVIERKLQYYVVLEPLNLPCKQVDFNYFWYDYSYSKFDEEFNVATIEYQVKC